MLTRHTSAVILTGQDCRAVLPRSLADISGAECPFYPGRAKARGGDIAVVFDAEELYRRVQLRPLTVLNTSLLNGPEHTSR